MYKAKIKKKNFKLYWSVEYTGLNPHTASNEYSKL